MINRLFLLLSICIFCSHYAQVYKVSRPEELIMQQYDTISYSDIRLTKSAEKLTELVARSERLNYRPGILKGLILLQSHMTRQGAYDLSEKYGNRAKTMALEDMDYNSLSLIAINRANTAIGLGLISEAKDVIYRNKPYADKILNKADKTRYFANSYMMLSGIYSRLKKDDSVVYYNRKSLEVMETVPVSKLTKLQKAKYYHLYIYQLMNMGIICLERQTPPDPALAEDYIRRALMFSKTYPQYFKFCDIEVYETASYIYLKKGQYDKSIYFGKKALEIEKTKRKPEERLSIYNDLKDVYKALKNETEELKYLELYTKLSDSLNKSQKNAIINQSREEIAEVKEASTSNRLKFIFGSLTVILLIVLGMWGFNIKRNKEYEKKFHHINTIIQNRIQNEKANEENGIITANNSIYTETEIKLLKKLTAFETSDKFLKSEISLNYLASMFKTNATYLSQVINNHKSQNFNSYINSLRINYITNKLYNEKQYREYKITYLAKECGYASPQVFTKAFKNEHGINPSYFIEQLKSAE